MNRSEDSFKRVFKYYKSKNRPPSLEKLISFANSNSNVFSIPTDGKANITKLKNLGIDVDKLLPLSHSDHEGLIFIKNPFTPLGQRYWIERCLKCFPVKPNKTNLDNEIIIDDWWKFCHESVENLKYLNKLRWTTLGYHHNWDTKVYSENSMNEFPKDLAELCICIAECLRFHNFVPQAAIVNYYHMDSTLSAHTDHSEVNLRAPLISISFGQSAIFLIGGKDKSIEPSALLIESGDILVMSEESRLCYHAVPKILPADSMPWNDEESDNWTLFDNYVRSNRINLNVRQVLEHNQSVLNVS